MDGGRWVLLAFVFLVSMTNLLSHLFNWIEFWSVSKDGGTSSFGTEEFLAIRHSSKFLRAHLVFLAYWVVCTRFLEAGLRPQTQKKTFAGYQS